VFETYADRLHVLPGSRSFRDTNEIVRGVEHRQTLQYHLGTAADAYTYVVIDCPPSLGDLTQAALSASQEVVMPIQCEYFAMEGLTQMIEVIRRVMKQPGRNLEFGGIVLTMYDESLELTGEVEREVREFFGDIVFETVVPRDVTVSEAPSFGKSVLDHAPRSRGARAYIELCMEV
ncbi:MAG: ParA family protein, partial [Planctomycetales bacterium]|nr:ParA family protein [Planctomycetales bacterium]